MRKLLVTLFFVSLISTSFAFWEGIRLPTKKEIDAFVMAVQPYCLEDGNELRCRGKLLQEYVLESDQLKLIDGVKRDNRVNKSTALRVGKFLLQTAAGEAVVQGAKYLIREIPNYESPRRDVKPCSTCGCKFCIPGFGLSK